MNQQGKTGFWPVGCIFLLVGCLFISGCLVIPIPEEYQFYGRRNIVTEEELSQLIIGETTREEILLKFGEPDFVSPAEDKFAYAWHMAKVVIFIQYGDIEIDERNLVLMEFDEDGVLELLTVEKFFMDSIEDRLRKLGFIP